MCFYFLNPHRWWGVAPSPPAPRDGQLRTAGEGCSPGVRRECFPGNIPHSLTSCLGCVQVRTRGRGAQTRGSPRGSALRLRGSLGCIQAQLPPEAALLGLSPGCTLTSAANPARDSVAPRQTPETTHCPLPCVPGVLDVLSCLLFLRWSTYNCLAHGPVCSLGLPFWAWLITWGLTPVSLRVQTADCLLLAEADPLGGSHHIRSCSLGLQVPIS